MSLNGRKGAAWEQTVADFFVDSGFKWAERRVQGGSKDRGDLSGIPGLMAECKNEQRITLSTYMDEVREQTAHCTEGTIGVAIVKRRNHSVGRAYVVMELEQFVEVIR